MKKFFLSILIILIFGGVNSQETKPVLLIHGGAGNITPNNLPDSIAIQYKTTLKKALQIGYSVLKDSGTSLDAVEASIVFLENSPLFNAGKGSVLTHNETFELDASIMDGKTLQAGCVAGIGNVKNPIRVARQVMNRSEHVLLSGSGAEEFANKQNLEIVDPSYFLQERRKKQLQRAKEKDSTSLDHDESGFIGLDDHKYGTVGVVALDVYGDLAAGTSTGGMTNKKYGRVGDSPLIGAGTYASNNACAVSCTGHGEYFIRLAVAHDIAMRMEYLGESVSRAAEVVIHEKLTQLGGSGGVIVLDQKGNYSMVFNSRGMFRGVKSGDVEKVEMFDLKD